MLSHIYVNLAKNTQLGKDHLFNKTLGKLGIYIQRIRLCSYVIRYAKINSKCIKNKRPEIVKLIEGNNLKKLLHSIIYRDILDVISEAEATQAEIVLKGLHQAEMLQHSNQQNHESTSGRKEDICKLLI